MPVAGKPFRTTRPVDKEHVGAVITPTTGVAGIVGCAIITILVDDEEMHPIELVTV